MKGEDCKKYIDSIQHVELKEMLNYLLSLLKELGSCCLKKCCWIWTGLRLYFFNYSGRIVVGYILVHLVSNRSVNLAGKCTVYHPIRTFSTCNAFKSSISGVKGCGVVERVVDTLLNLQKKVRQKYLKHFEKAHI